MKEQNNLFSLLHSDCVDMSEIMTYEELIKRTKRRIIKRSECPPLMFFSRTVEERDATTYYEFYIEDEMMIAGVSPIMLIDYEKSQEEFIDDWYKAHKR